MSEIETIAQGDGSRLVEPRRFLLRDPTAFRAIWAAHAGPDASPPVVDFESRMVAAVFAGKQSSSEDRVAVGSTRLDGEVLEILIQETNRPSDSSSAGSPDTVSPFHIVSLPRYDGEIRFSAARSGPPAATIIFNREPRTKHNQPRITRITRSGPQHASAQGDPAQGGSSTGLTPTFAAALAYLAGPFSGMLLLATERSNTFVRFHAWQAVLALGVLGVAAVLFLMLAFALLIVSPTAFWAMLWLAATSGAAWVSLWAICLLQASKGRLWKVPVAGDFAERFTSLPASAAR